jgi:hypothetical protein
MDRRTAPTRGVIVLMAALLLVPAVAIMVTGTFVIGLALAVFALALLGLVPLVR